MRFFALCLERSPLFSKSRKDKNWSLSINDTCLSLDSSAVLHLWKIAAPDHLNSTCRLTLLHVGIVNCSHGWNKKCHFLRYTCVVEYALICAGVSFVFWTNVGKAPREYQQVYQINDFSWRNTFRSLTLIGHFIALNNFYVNDSIVHFARMCASLNQFHSSVYCLVDNLSSKERRLKKWYDDSVMPIHCCAVIRVRALVALFLSQKCHFRGRMTFYRISISSGY